MRRRLLLAVVVGLAVAGSAGAAATPFRLTSPAFAHNATIPLRFTCFGANGSPALRWTAPPAGTRSFALELHDPDAPRAGGFTHWLAWGFPASARGIAAGRNAPVEGAGDSGAFGYTGPCPPSGVHRYRFTLYALDAPLRLGPGAMRGSFQRALRGHVRARAVLVGRFGAPPR